MEAFTRKYNPKTITRGADHIVRQYPKHKMEVTQSYGMTEDLLLFIEAVLEENYTNGRNTDSLSTIQETIQGYVGGHWGVQFFDSPYMFFSTSFRRSPAFVVFDIDDNGVAVVKNS